MKISSSLLATFFIAASLVSPVVGAPTTQKTPARPVVTAEERYAAKVAAIRADWSRAGAKFYEEFYAKGAPIDSPALRAALQSLRRQNRRFVQIAPVPASMKATQAKIQAGMSRFEMALQQNELYLKDRKDAHLQKAELLNDQAATLFEAAQNLLSQTLQANKGRQRPRAATNDSARTANPAGEGATSTPDNLTKHYERRKI
jgi:hypothetical protein